MKKSCWVLFIYIFIIQSITPAFAQSQNSQIQAFDRCLNTLTQNNEVFKTDVGIGENWSRLNMIKGILLDIPSGIKKEVEKKDPKNIARTLTIITATGKGLSVAYFYMSYRTSKVKFKLFTPAKIGVSAFFAVLGVANLMVWNWANNQEKNILINQNDQDVSSQTIASAGTIYDVFLQISSESDTAKTFLNNGIQRCYELVDSVRFYDKNPELITQDFPEFSK